MNTLRNKVQLFGNVGQDPELKVFESGKKIVRFTLATTETYKNVNGERVSETTWHNIVAWNGLAEIASKHVKKGQEIAIEGKLTYRNYENKKGTTKYIAEIVVNDLIMTQKRTKIS